MRANKIGRIIFMASLLTCFVMISCQSAKKSATKTNAICMWDRTALRAEPEENGKWLASLQLGETVQCTGKTGYDSTNQREYLEITLSDGKTGWAKSDLLIVNARLGAIKETTPIYRRPDLLTFSDKNFEMMDMVAVIDTADVWIHAIGKEKRKKGWIQANAVIFDKDEVTVAILAEKTLDQAGGVPLSETLIKLKEQLPFPDSYFLKKLEEKATEETSVSEELIEY